MAELRKKKKISDQPRVKSVYLVDGLWDKIQRLADQNGASRNAMVEYILLDYVEKHMD